LFRCKEPTKSGLLGNIGRLVFVYQLSLEKVRRPLKAKKSVNKNGKTSRCEKVIREGYAFQLKD